MLFRSEKIESIWNAKITSGHHPLNTPTMSSKNCQSAILVAKSASRQIRLFRITPPPVFNPKRTYFTRRSTSFYTNSYPQSSSSGVEIPYIPPPPISERPVSYVNDDGVHEDGRRKERKAKYLESLMDKAGELSLRCKLMTPCNSLADG